MKEIIKVSNILETRTKEEFLSQIREEFFSYNGLDYKEVQSNVTYSDLEKGYQDKDHIFKRSDGKFFKIECSWTPNCYHKECDQIDSDLEEVVPKEKVITVYE